MLVSLTVGEIMSEPVATVGADATAREVAEQLEAANIGSLVVLDGGEPTGIVTESDLVGLLAGNVDVDDVTVVEFVSGELVTAEPGTPLDDAADLLASGNFRRLPVVEGGELVGIVTTTDLSYYLPRLVGGRGDGSGGTPRYDVRPETTYEREGWEFECHGVADEGVGVGDVVRFSKVLTEGDVEAFAEASGDTNRLHLEESYAERTRFGGRIVHGTLVGGLVSAALARLPGLTIYLSQELSFRGPVRIDERVTAVCEVIESLGGDRYLLRTNVFDSDEELVIEGEAVVLVDDLPDGAGVEREELD